MPKTISIAEAEHDLRGLLNSLSEDESITIVDETGAPVARISAPANGSTEERAELESFMDDWDELAQRIDEAWQGEKSAVEQLQKDRSRLDRTKDSEPTAD